MGSGNILWKFGRNQIIFLDFTGTERLKEWVVQNFSEEYIILTFDLKFHYNPITPSRGSNTGADIRLEKGKQCK